MERTKVINKVLNAEPFEYSTNAIKLWEEKGYVYQTSSWNEIMSSDIFEDVTVLIVRLNTYVDSKVIDKFPNLNYVVSATTGHDHIDLEYLEKNKVKLISLRGHDEFLKTISSTAEHTWALLMSLIRNIPQANEHVKNGNWNRDLFRGYQLKGKTIGIIGLGRTGAKVAEYATAFGMKVQYYDPYVTNELYVKEAQLNNLLASSHVISIHVHLNEETERLVNKTNIHFVRKNSLIINTSRGKVWNEDVIVAALEDKQLLGIATDVLTTELNDIKESKLWQTQQQDENIIITPHIGGATYDAMWACEEYIVASI